MADDCNVSAFYAFGPFRLDPVGRTLVRDGQKVSLTPRVFDLLLCLLENAGRTVDRRELMRAAWGERVVEDSNLRQTIYELRKAVEPAGGAPVIATVPLRGYRLTLPVQLVAPAAVVAPTATVRPLRWRLPRGLRWAAQPRALLLVALVPAAVFALHMLSPARKPGAAAPPPQSVAVLPFTVPGRDASQDEFADSISTELINALSRVGGLRVSARTSSFLFRNRPLPATDVARQLNVSAVLEGSIVRQGARVRIVAELVDGASGFAIWSHRYDIDNSDLFEAQANIAEAVATSLQVVLANGHVADVALGGTHNAAAYDAYLRGMKYARDAIDESERQAARSAFEAAITLDPNFAVARAWRARELAEIVNKSVNCTPVQLQPLLADAAAEAERALALAPDLGIAHLALADIFQVRQEFAAAQREMSLAREYAPSDVQVLIDDVFLQVALSHSGAALQAAELGVSLDPLAPSAYTALGYAQQALRDYDGAIASLRHARLLGADAGDIALMEAIVELERGDNQVAAQDCAHGAKGWVNDLCLAVAEHRLGQVSEAMFHFAALRATLGENGAFQYAEVYAQWRQPDEAVKWLAVAYRTHDTGLATMRTNVLLDPIRETPQYAAIERQLQFPP